MNFELYKDITANNSSKTIVVPEWEEWDLATVFVNFISSSATGNRQLQLSLLAPDNTTIFQTRALDVQAASLTNTYAFMPGGDNEAHTDAKWFQNALPMPCRVPAGYQILILDAAGVDATHDDMSIFIHYRNMYRQKGE